MKYIWGEWPSGLMHCDQNQKVPSSNLTQSGLGTPPRYEGPYDPPVELVKTQ